MKFVLVSVILFLGVAQADSTQPLFVIERSTNSNVVHYEARLGENMKLNESDPVLVYWEMKTKGGKRQELTGIERRRAYGFKFEPDAANPGSVLLHLVPYDKRKLRVSAPEGVAFAEITIDGKLSKLKKIFIHTVGKSLVPGVDYIELFGTEVASGASTYEKILNPSKKDSK